ncbi:MAG: prolyl oligopeptidase family serine peptidase, partial [Armatimonadota bacterium]
MALPPLISREVLFGNPERVCVRISPDGSQIGYIAPSDGVLNVWVRSREGSDDRVVTHSTHRGIPAFFWTYDGQHICYIQDKDGDENWHVYAVDLTTLEERDLTPYENVQAHIASVRPEFPNEIIVAMNREDPHLHDIYRIDISTGDSELMVQNPGDIVGWDIDWRHKVRGGTAQCEDGENDLRFYHEDTDEWETLVHAPFGESVFAFGVTPDEKGFYISTTLESNTAQIGVLDFETKATTVLAQRPDVDPDGDFIVHPTKHHLQAVSFTKARKEWQFLDSDLQSHYAEASKLQDGEFDLVSRDIDDRWWIVAFTSDVDPVKYYLYDKQTRNGQYLFSQKKSLEEAVLAPMTPTEIKTRDGLTMICYLTLPVGIEQKNLPLILNVHGGPWHRDDWGLNSEVQWLANRGYAVLQVNYRGSTGFGKDFINAANKEWGGKMHDDLIDAVNWSVEQGIADPAKLGSFGASYGGYATLVG